MNSQKKGSPDGAQRYPGMVVTVVKPSPDCHPGYKTWKRFDGERSI